MLLSPSEPLVIIKKKISLKKQVKNISKISVFASVIVFFFKKKEVVCLLVCFFGANVLFHYCDKKLSHGD